MLFRRLRDRLTGRDVRDRLALIESYLDRFAAHSNHNVSQHNRFVDHQISTNREIDRKLALLLHESPSDYAKLDRRLDAVEKSLETMGEQVTTLGDFATELPSLDTVAELIDSSEECVQSNLAARLRDLATAIEADRDFEATEEALRSGRIEFADATTLTDLGFDLDAEGDTEPFLPAVQPPVVPRCDDCTCERAE